LNTKAKFLVISLLLCASASQALTLGRMRGAALIGQRLDVTVAVQADPGEDLASSCLEADVFHADSRQDPARVRVSVESGTAPAGQVRIQSASPIDEPIVTVYLRVGCTQKSSRRYVLLADMPSDVQPPAVALVRPEPARVEPVAVAPPAPAPSTVAAPQAAASSAQPAVAPQPRSATPAVVSKAVKPKVAQDKPSRSKPATSAPAISFKLKLDPLEYFSDRVSKLDSAALLAQAAQASPDAQKMQKLETDVKALQAVATKSAANMADMRRQLELAQEQAYPAELVYGLGFTTLLGLLAAGGLWWRGRRAQAKASEWWDANEPTADADAVPPMTQAKTLETVAAPEIQPKAEELAPVPQIEAGLSQTAELSSFLKGLEPVSEVDVSLVDMSESTFDQLLLSSEPASLNTTVSSLRAPLKGGAEPARRYVSPAEVADVRQKAEFFITLGQTEQAVHTLQYCIAESDLPHPALYLDLMALMHSLSEKTEFGLLRDESERLFNLSMPDFARFGDEGQDLQAYPEVLADLSGVWPGPRVLPMIDMHMFRDPHGPVVPSLELAAFRDLMLLADMAGALQASGDPAWAEEVAPVPAVPELPALSALPAVSSGAAMTSAAAGAAVDLPLDFELDLSLPATDVSAAAAPPDPGNLIDFDFDDLPKPGKV
jgi:hypothetical protein